MLRRDVLLREDRYVLGHSSPRMTERYAHFASTFKPPRIPLQARTAIRADLVLAHSAGGTHDAENYLASHLLCNHYRWDYMPEEFQWILKIGVWAKTQIERRSRLGRDMAEAFVKHEAQRVRRRRAQV